MGEIYVFDRALSNTEIQQLYQWGFLDGRVTNDDLTPMLDWAYSDPDRNIQTNIQLDVSTDPTFANVTHWDYNPVAHKREWVEYAGTTLTNDTYYWRVRTNDGKEWSEWSPTFSFVVDIAQPQPADCSV